ncbi:MAG: DUF6339 family protein [Planctomycetia bacterium]|nr:DUF6339 family protein [Planctomycetia bacterium]
MTILKGLAPSGRRVLVTEEFRRGDPETVDATGHVEELEWGRDIDLAPLRAVIEEAMRRCKSQDSDAWLGPRVHATLRLTRREASDKRVWEYLNVVEFPEYVRWRWFQEAKETPVPLDRFLGPDNKNSLGRLWWTAELTRNGSDYTPAVAALKFSQFFLWQGLNFSHHRAAALAAVAFLTAFGKDGATNPQTQAMAKAVNVALRTICLDALAPNSPTDAEVVGEWIAEKIDATLMMEELPKGPDEDPVDEADITAVRKFLNELADRIHLAEVKAERRPTPALPGKE